MGLSKDFNKGELPPLRIQDARQLGKQLISEAKKSPQDCDVAKARELVRRGAPVDFESAMGYTALYFAAREGNLALTLALLELGAAASGTSSLNAPLAEAARKGYRDIALALVRAGADTSCADSNKRTPLHHAVHFNDAELCAALLAKGANPDVTDFESHSPLSEAALKGRHTLVRLIAKHLEPDIPEPPPEPPAKPRPGGPKTFRL
jgi:ankyrin repeat protein